MLPRRNLTGAGSGQTCGNLTNAGVFDGNACLFQRAATCKARSV